MVVRKWQKFSKFQFTGDWQLHTNVTDGKSNPREYFERAEELNTEFLLFSEHVRKRLDYNYLKFKESVYKAGSLSTVKFAVGAEAKVLDEYGNLDISETLIDEVEVLLTSFHSHNFTTKSEYKRALFNAVKNPITDIWAHPTSYHNEMGFDMNYNDWIEIFNVLMAEGVGYELNKKYPTPSNVEFKILKSMQFSNVVFGSDAHHSNDLLTNEERNNFKLLLGYEY
tara:strand:- start:3082 stop:3756 length:675 start_codon:yes stop_codon:yes gene_type:complete